MSLTELLGNHSTDMTVDSDGDQDNDGANALDRRGEAIKPPSAMGKVARFRVLQKWFKVDAEKTANWRTGARSDFAFRAGDQWDDTDKEVLKEAKRPIIVFNRALTILKAVAGMEINGRHEIQFLPQNNEVTQANELLSAASKWMSAGCDAEDEQSEAFDDCATCGMGWTESRLSYEDDPTGMYVEEAINPLEMFWDYSCSKRNLTGARRMARARRIPVSEAMQLFPGKTVDQLDATWADLIDFNRDLKTLEERRRRDTDDEITDTYDDLNTVTIVHMQWIEKEVYWLVADPMTNSKSELTDEQYERLRDRFDRAGIPLTAARMIRKVYKQAFLGSEELSYGDAPVKGRFIWQCITGERDRTKGTFFGLIKIMRDPQMWANKWLSQVLHILNSTAKGGIIAELDAFEDQRDAERKLAMPDSIVWAADGAISGNKPKIMPKPGQGLADGHVQLMQFAITAIRDCTGINLELLGQQDQNQPGVLEAQRKQAGMTVLATLFDSLRRFRKNVGFIRLYYIQNYFSDGRLIRVAGPTAARALPLLRDKTFGRYDVIIDDAPTSPNQKEANWAVIAPMLGMFKEQLAAKPALLAAILEYSPMPAQLVELIKQMVAQDQADPEKQQTAQQMKALGIQKLVAEINKDQSTAEMNNAKAGATQATASYDLAMAQNLLQKGEFDKLKFHLDAMSGAAAARKAEADSVTAHAKAGQAVVQTHAQVAQVAQNQRASDQQHEIDRGQLANDTMEAHANVAGTMAGAANDIAQAHHAHAKAHRERVGAIIDALQPVQPPAGAQQQ
jgi:hypothetical protein